MSPFDAQPRRLLSCLQHGPGHLDEHARTCACPCPPCAQLQWAYTNKVGLVARADVPAFAFLFTLGHFKIAQLSGAEWSTHFRLFSEIEREHDVRVKRPEATIGWLVRDGEELRTVRAPSDPWRAEVDRALDEWADAAGERLRS